MTIIVLCRCVPSADHDHDDNVMVHFVYTKACTAVRSKEFKPSRWKNSYLGGKGCEDDDMILGYTPSSFLFVYRRKVGVGSDGCGVHVVVHTLITHRPNNWSQLCASIFVTTSLS